MFTATNPELLQKRTEQIVAEEPQLFKRLMSLGKRLLEFAELLDVTNFNKMVTKGDPIFEERPELRDFLFWHVTRATKAVVKRKSALFLGYLCDFPLKIDLTHPAFEGLLHFFIWSCKDDTEALDDLNSQIVEMLVKNGRLPNEIDAVTSSTPLHVASRIGNPALVGTLISKTTFTNLELGGDVNAVNEKEEMPLSIAKAEILKITSLQSQRKKVESSEEEVKEVFQEIPSVGQVNLDDYKAQEKVTLERLLAVVSILEKKGAKTSWRS